MFRKAFAFNVGQKAGDQAFQYQGGLARSGYAGHGGKAPFGDVRFKGADGMDGVDGQADMTLIEHLGGRRRFSGIQPGMFREKRADPGGGMTLDIRDRAFGDHLAAIGPRVWAHFDHPVGGP